MPNEIYTPLTFQHSKTTKTTFYHFFHLTFHYHILVGHNNRNQPEIFIKSMAYISLEISILSNFGEPRFGNTVTQKRIKSNKTPIICLQNNLMKIQRNCR